MDDLDSKQRQALLQLRELTDGADDEVSISMLSIVDWDVQRAAELIFEGGSPSGIGSGFGSGRRNASRPGSSSAATVASSSSSTSSQMDTFEIDDTQQGVYGGGMPTYPPGRARVQNAHFLYTLARPILSVLAFPLHILSNLVRFIFSILCIPLPRLPFASSWLNFYLPLSSRRPGGGGGGGSGGARGIAGPERWLRELEEETGAISIGRLKAIRGTSSGVGMGDTSLNSRGGANAGGASTSGAKTANGKVTIEFEDGRKYLPDFAICTYEELLKTCQREMKVGCVVLVSDEHDDVPEFKRSTLTDPGFVKILYENDIVVWGGDVRDREAWSAAEKLQATTYPFVAFVALQPRRNPGFSSPSSSRSNAPPTLTVLSRHQGPSYTPLSSSSLSTATPAPTSAQALISHLERQLLPRVTPYLNRLLSAQRERERDRQLREEQDRAFEDAKRRDKEKIERKMKEEREMVEQRRREEEQKRKEEARKRKEAEDRKKRAEMRVIWRRWTRRCVVGKSERHATGGGGGGGGVRIAIRLPSGTRVIHTFSASNATLTSLYAFVDAQLIPKDMSPVDDPISVGGQIKEGEEALEAHILSCCSTTDSQQSYNKHAYNTVEDYWGFRIATAYPRVEIPWTKGVKLADVEHLRSGGQVVVEAVQNESSYGQQERSGGGEESDGYDTEDSK